MVFQVSDTPNKLTEKGSICGYRGGQGLDEGGPKLQSPQEQALSTANAINTAMLRVTLGASRL